MAIIALIYNWQKQRQTRLARAAGDDSVLDRHRCVRRVLRLGRQTIAQRDARQEVARQSPLSAWAANAGLPLVLTVT